MFEIIACVLLTTLSFTLFYIDWSTYPEKDTVTSNFGNRLFGNFRRTFLTYFLALMGWMGLPITYFLPYALTSLLNMFLLLAFTIGSAFFIAFGMAWNRDINRSWEKELAEKRAARQNDKL